MMNPNASVQEMIYSQMHHFMQKVADKGQVTFDKAVEVATWTAAFVIRQRHIQNGQITDTEIQMVLGTIGNFCKENFGDDFTQEDFNLLSIKTLELLKMPTFDSDSKEYFMQFYR